MTKEMKSSDERWVYSIPPSWRVEPLKHHCSMFKGLPILKTDLVEEGVPVISYGQIHSKDNTGTHLDESLLRFIPASMLAGDESSKLRKGDVVFADTSEDVEGIGNAALIDTDGVVYAGYHTVICRPNQSSLSGRFFAYLARTDAWRYQLRNLAMGVKVFSITQAILRRSEVLLPPLDEQERIADFLDERCAVLDVAVKLICKQITNLEFYRHSIIHETVTQGLNPNVTMKPSGVEWIGNIPSNWRVSRLRYLASFESGATPSKDSLEFWAGTIPWVSSQEVKEDILLDTSLHITSAAISSCSTRILPEGTLVMVVRSGILQHTIPVALLGRPMTINQDIKALQFNCEMLSKYFLYLVKGNNDNLLKALIKDKSTVDNINFEYLLSLSVPVPSIDEQESIVSYLDRRCSVVDAVLETKRKQLEVLKKKRQSLIYEYVTGKRRVSKER